MMAGFSSTDLVFTLVCVVAGAALGWWRARAEGFGAAGRVFAVLAGAAGLAALALRWGWSFAGLWRVALVGMLLAIAVSDAKRAIIPNHAVLAVALLWVAREAAQCVLLGMYLLAAAGNLPVTGVLSAVFSQAGQDVLAALLGAAVTGGPVLVLTLVAGARGHDAMGGGDIKLLFAVGLFFSWREDLLALLLACMAAAVMGLIRRAKTGKSTMPFGCAIAIGWLVAALL